MRRVTGLPDEQVLAWESKLEAQVVASLQAVMDKIAARIDKIQVASGLSTVERAERVAGGSTSLRDNDSCSPDSPHWTRSPYPGVLVAVATTGPTGDDDPPPMTGELAIPEPVPLPEVLPQTPGLPPGQPYISPDDLASITPLWQSEVVNQVLPLVAQVFIDSAGALRSQMLDHVAPGVVLGVPGLGSVAAEAYLAQARNTYEQVGDHLWATARAQLSEGFEAGESIPQLAARLRQSAGLSARTAVMVARTSVIEASNAGSMSMARASGVELLKSWQATNDARTRPAHLAAEAQYEADPIPLNQPFIVGGYPAQFPAADTLPPAQRYRCRCTTLYLMPDKVEALPEPGLAELPGTSGVAEIEAPPPVVPDIETEAFPKLPGEAGFDLDDFPEPPPLKVRSSLLRARTDRELIAAWQGEMRAITGRDIIVQLPPDASVLTMREHAEGVLQMLERFPEARLRKISWYDAASTEYAHVRAGAATLEFNARWASTAMRRDYLASLRHDVSGWDATTGPGYGWSVRNGSRPQATSWHEMAHILSIETLGGKLKAEALRITLRRMAADGAVDMGDYVSRQISAYAASRKGNFEEMIAEAMTDVMANGPRASLLSRELYDMVAREYRAKGFAVRTAELPGDGDLGFEDFTREGETFPKLPAPKPLARMTVAELRAQAKARGVTVPAGTRKADLVRMLDEAPPAGPGAAVVPTGVSGNPALTATKFVPPDEAIAAAMRHYTLDQGYKGVNSSLRRSGGVLPDDVDYYVRRDVAALDRAFAEAKGAKRAISVTRAIPDAREIFPDGQIRVGATWTDEGFVSTSVESGDSLGAVFAGGERPLRMQIVAPKGTKAISAGPYQRRDLLDPDEVLLDRGLTYRVVRDNGVDANGVRRIDVEVVPRGVDVPSVPLPTPAPVSAALPARVVVARTELARVVEGPVVREPYSVGGSGAKNRRIGYEGGDVIEKDYTRGTKSQGVRDADAEELGALVMDALDVPTQTVLRAGPQRVIVSVLEGEHPGDFGPLTPGAAREALADTDGGRLLGLGDVLIGNSDRRRNWVRLPDDRPASYDLGGAFRTPKLAAASDPEGLFAHHFATAGGKAWAPNDMAPGDLALIRERLEALRPEFERLKRTTWFTQMMGRLAEVEKRATGTRSRLGGVVGELGPEARAVARQAVIDERRAVAESLGEVRELLANGASERALASRARLIAGRSSRVAGEDLAGVVRAMESGDADRIRVAIGDVAQRRNLTDVGPDGGADVVPFDPKIHELVGGARRPPAGTYVQVMRPGYSVRLDDGEIVQLGKARVDTLTVEEIATRTAAQERKALREATRERARVVESQRATAKLLAEVDELAAKGATKTAIRERLDPALREAGQAYAGADAAAVDALSAALDSGDLAKVRAAVTRAGTKAKIKPIGRAGAKTTFDPDTMEGVGGIDIAPGARVTVVRRGSRIEGIETPEKAQVTPARAASTAKTVARGDFTGLTRVGPQLGGNPGGIFEAGDGSRWYVKAAEEGQARSEALALDLYREAGLDAPRLIIGQGAEGLGRRQVATQFFDDAEVDLRLRFAEDPTYIAEVQDGFAVDAWLANWDVIGANPAPGKGWDNIVSVAGRPVRIEAGGALRYRGLGSNKPFGDVVTEIETMRLKTKTAQGTIRATGAVFGDMTPAQIVASAERVRKITPAKIKALVKRHDLDPELAETLIERRANLLTQAEALAGPKPMTAREYAAAIKAAAKGQDALDAVEAGITGHTPDIPGQPIHTIWRGDLGDDIKVAIERYAGNDFDTVNGALRGKSHYESLARPIIVDMDRALDSSRLTVDIELWRAPGSGRSIFGDPETWGDDLAGFEWSDPAYSSASAIRRIADRFTKDGGVRLRVLAPKGSKALQLSPEKSSLAKYEKSAAEAEILLGRGARYRVVEDRGWTEITHPSTRQKIRVRDLDVEAVVPDRTPPLPWEAK